jgi:hypothetical protein
MHSAQMKRVLARIGGGQSIETLWGSLITQPTIKYTAHKAWRDFPGNWQCETRAEFPALFNALMHLILDRVYVSQAITTLNICQALLIMERSILVLLTSQS